MNGPRVFCTGVSWYYWEGDDVHDLARFNGPFASEEGARAALEDAEREEEEREADMMRDSREWSPEDYERANGPHATRARFGEGWETR